MQVHRIQQTTNFKSSKNLGEYLSKITVSTSKEVKNLKQIQTSLKEETIKNIYKKRANNELEVLKNVSLAKNNLDYIKESINSNIDNVKKSLNLFSDYEKVSPNEKLRKDFKQGFDYILTEKNQKIFENNIKDLNIKNIEFINTDEQTIIKDLRTIYKEFIDNDSVMMINYFKDLKTFSNKFFSHAGDDIKKIKKLEAGSKKLEYIPVAGIIPKMKRVDKQETATLLSYEHFQEYNKKFIIEGIVPVITSYIEKSDNIKKYVELISPFLSKSTNEFTKQIFSKTESNSELVLKKYEEILSGIVSNNDMITHCYDKIITDGAKSLVLKTIRILIFS